MHLFSSWKTIPANSPYSAHNSVNRWARKYLPFLGKIPVRIWPWRVTGRRTPYRCVSSALHLAHGTDNLNEYHTHDRRSCAKVSLFELGCTVNVIEKNVPL